MRLINSCTTVWRFVLFVTFCNAHYFHIKSHRRGTSRNQLLLNITVLSAPCLLLKCTPAITAALNDKNFYERFLQPKFPSFFACFMIIQPHI